MVLLDGTEISAVMAAGETGCRRGMGFRGPVLVAALFAVSAVLGGCSSVPDAVNPAAWYRGTVGALSGDDKDKKEEQTAESPDPKQSPLAADRGKPVPGAGKPYPKLGLLPELPKVTPKEERQRIIEGLISDREGRSYSSRAIPRQDEIRRARGADKGPAAPAAAKPPAVSMPAPPPPAMVPPAVAAPVAPPPAPPPAPEGVKQGGVAAPARSRPAAEEAPNSPPALPPRAAPEKVSSVKAPAAKGAPAPPPARVASAAGRRPAAAEGPGTVVISSKGVEVERATAAARIAPASSRPAGARGPDRGAAGKRPVKVATILFEDGSAHLSYRDRRILGKVRELYGQRGGKMRVVGHASQRTRSMDPERHKKVNYRISMDRANAVARELIRLGVPESDILVDAVSDSEPVYYEIMPSGEAGNRRAEIFIVD